MPLYSPDFPGTCYIDQADLKLTEVVFLPLLPSVGIKRCTTTPGSTKHFL